jgi:predicted SAM-dependent methyltransferase
LHIAPERSIREIFENDKEIDYLTADLMQEDVMVKMDLVDIQYPDNTFNGIICSHVLEHIPDDRKAMRELYRVLKPGGWALLQVPISKIMDKTYEDFSIVDPKQRERYFGQVDHVRIYGQDYIQRLQESGFIVKPYLWTEDKKLRRNTNLDKMGLNPEEKLFYCRKPNPPKATKKDPVKT